MLKRILSHSAIYGLAPNISKVIGILLLPIITKYLTEVDFGIYGTITAYTSGIAVLSNLGMAMVLTTSFYRSRTQYKWLWRQVYGFLQLWMILFAIAQAILLYFIIPEEAIENRWAIIILSNISICIFGPTSLIGTMHYRLIQKPLPIAIRTVIAGILTILTNLFFIVFLEWGYMGWFVSLCVSQLFTDISYWWVVNKGWGLSPIYNFKFRTIKNALKIGIPAIPHYYSTYLLNTSSRLVLDKTGVQMSEIGKFSLAHQFGGYFDMFASAISMAINPMTLEDIRNDREDEAKKKIYIMFLIILFATCTTSLWLKEILDLLINNDQLKKIYPLGIILIMATNYRSMYIASSNMFFYYGKTKGLLKITTIAGVLAFISYVVTIPIWGLWGAVVTNYIALMYMGYSGFFMKEYKVRAKVDYPIFRIALLTIIMTIFVFLAVEIELIFKILITSAFIATSIVSFFKLRLNLL